MSPNPRIRLTSSMKPPGRLATPTTRPSEQPSPTGSDPIQVSSQGYSWSLGCVAGSQRRSGISHAPPQPINRCQRTQRCKTKPYISNLSHAFKVSITRRPIGWGSLFSQSQARSCPLAQPHSGHFSNSERRKKLSFSRLSRYCLPRFHPLKTACHGGDM